MFLKKMFVAAALSAATVVAASAQNAVGVQSGKTSLTLAPSLTATLSGLGVAMGVVAPAVDASGVVALPIVTGAFDLDTAKGEIFHNGGLTFTAGGTVVAVTDFLIDTTDDSIQGGTTPVLSALVIANGVVRGRLALFNLGQPIGFKLPVKPQNQTFTLNGSAVTLNPTAAAAINAEFGVSALTPGLAIGTLSTTVVVGNPL